MATDDQVIELIYRVIQDINADLPVDQQMPENPDTVLLGFGSPLDSLLLVRLLLSLERKIFTEFGAKPALMADVELLSEDGPLSTIGTLSGYLASLLSLQDAPNQAIG